MDELKNFLSGLDSDQQPDVDPFSHVQEANPEEGVQPEIDVEPEPEYKPRNRRERRLEAKLEAERNAAIQLAEELRIEREAKRVREEGADYLTSIERIYGTDSPEAREATEILKSALVALKEDAKREALGEIESRTMRESQAVAEAEETLDTMVDEISDEFGVELTPEEEADFYRLMERMSPKDRDGNIVSYADHFSVWETYESLRQRQPDNTARQLAARSMANGSGAGNSNLTADTHERYLRENGII